MMIAAALFATHVYLCGVKFDLPAKWTANVEREDDDANEHVKCRIAIRPPGFSEKAERSPWEADDPPMSLLVADSFDDVVNATGFDHDENGNLIVPSRGYAAKAGRFQIGQWSGVRGEGWFRGYPKQEAKITGGAGLYSSNAFYVAIHSGKRNVGISCVDGVANLSVDCERVVSSLLRSLR